MSEKLKHTLGPWELRCSIPDENDHILIKSDKILSVKKGEESIALCGHINNKEAQANAKLIAAAPELLEACNEAIKYFKNTSNVFEQLNKAIKKATE